MTTPTENELRTLAATLLSMVRDLHNGWPPKELAATLEEVEAEAKRLGVGEE